MSLGTFYTQLHTDCTQEETLSTVVVVDVDDGCHDNHEGRNI